MSLLVSFRLFDEDGDPLTGAAVGFTHYVDATATPAASPPTINELQPGLYGFNLDTVSDVRIYQIDGTVDAHPRYLVGANGGGAQAFGTYDEDGALAVPSGSPTFLEYVNSVGGAQVEPAIFDAGGASLWAFVPSSTDISQGRAFVVDTGGDVVPESYDGTVGDTEDIPTPASVVITGSSGLGQVNGQSNASAIGIDVSTFPELADGFTLISGRRLGAEAAYRRLTTGRGQLSFYPDVGKDLRSYLNAEVTDAQMFACKTDIERELERDERFRSVVATVAYSVPRQELTARVEIDIGDGPFPFTLLVTALDVKLVLESGQ